MSDVTDPNQMIALRHDEVDGVARVTVQAFEDVYRYKGWVPVTTEDVKELRRADLNRLAAEWGVVITGDEPIEEVARRMAGEGVVRPADLPENLSSLKKDELEALAVDRGLDPDGKKKDEIVSMLEGDE